MKNKILDFQKIKNIAHIMKTVKNLLKRMPSNEKQQLSLRMKNQIVHTTALSTLFASNGCSCRNQTLLFIPYFKGHVFAKNLSIKLDRHSLTVLLGQRLTATSRPKQTRATANITALLCQRKEF